VLNYCSEHMELWGASVKKFDSGERLLLEQAYYFPANWKQFSMLEAEWNRFRQAFDVKKAAYRDEFDSIRTRLLKEEDGSRRRSTNRDPVEQQEAVLGFAAPEGGPGNHRDPGEDDRGQPGQLREAEQREDPAGTAHHRPVSINSIGEECVGPEGPVAADPGPLKAKVDKRSARP
jgi:hypothetical protein